MNVADAGTIRETLVEGIGPVSHQGGCDDGADHEQATYPAHSDLDRRAIRLSARLGVRGHLAGSPPSD